MTAYCQTKNRPLYGKGRKYNDLQQIRCQSIRETDCYTHINSFYGVDVFSFTHGWHSAGTPEWQDPTKLTTFKVKWKITPMKFGKDGAMEWEQPLDGLKGARLPTFGDIIPYPGHVGVYLGRKLYVSSTTWPFLSRLQGEDGVIHVTNDNQEQLYRSPE